MTASLQSAGEARGTTLSASWSSEPAPRAPQARVQVGGGPWSNSVAARNSQGRLKTRFCTTSPQDPVASASHLILIKKNHETPCCMASWMGREFGGEWIHVSIYVSTESMDMSLSQLRVEVAFAGRVEGGSMQGEDGAECSERQACYRACQSSCLPRPSPPSFCCSTP